MMVFAHYYCILSIYFILLTKTVVILKHLSNASVQHINFSFLICLAFLVGSIFLGYKYVYPRVFRKIQNYENGTIQNIGETDS
jgi:hypothetical protein